MVSDGKKSAMKGNFTYIGLDIDTTGRRLIDEIVNIAAYTPETEYSQHIMPLMNLNPGARQRHQIRVINVGCFRMLKSMQTYKVIKTKTEIAALLEFLDWLEAANTKDGVIFVYHEQLKFTPYMVIEAMKKYRLFERFEKTVKSFVNGYDLAGEKNGGEGIKYLTLAQNLKIQKEKLEMPASDSDDFEGDAAVRAKLTYEIFTLMAHGGEKKEVEKEKMDAIINDFVRVKAKPISSELEEILEQEECIKRQSSLREVFRGYFQTSRYHRRRAVTFRRILAEAKYDMDKLQALWTEGKREALETEVKKLEELKEEDYEEMIELLDSHFDPEKQAVKPVVQRRDSVSNGDGTPHQNGNGNGNNMRRRRRGPRGPRGRSLNKENRGSPREQGGQGQRMDNRRKRSSDKRFNNNNNDNNNNNNVMDHQKGGAIRKEHQQQVDMNQNNMVSAN